MSTPCGMWRMNKDGEFCLIGGKTPCKCGGIREDRYGERCPRYEQAMNAALEAARRGNRGNA